MLNGQAMNTVLALTQRELGAYFLSPIAYVVTTIFLFMSGLAFGVGTFTQGGEASLRPLLDGWMVVFLVFLLPMFTMRLLSDELRGGTIETLMTAPVTDTQVVLGKFIGAFAFFLVLLGTLLLYPILISMYASIDLKLLVCHLLGLVLLGGLYIAAGLFFSACTKHQVIAVLLTVAILPLLTLAADRLSLLVDGFPRAILQHLSIYSHYRDFVRGRLEFTNLMFFLTSTAFLLFLTVKRLEMRRWQ